MEFNILILLCDLIRCIQILINTLLFHDARDESKFDCSVLWIVTIRISIKIHPRTRNKHSLSCCQAMIFKKFLVFFILEKYSLNSPESIPVEKDEYFLRHPWILDRRSKASDVCDKWNAEFPCRDSSVYIWFDCKAEADIRFDLLHQLFILTQDFYFLQGVHSMAFHLYLVKYHAYFY